MEDTDILIVSWSSSTPYGASEIQELFDKVIETIHKYECRNLLIDASEAKVSIDDSTMKTLLTNFVSELSLTGIEKVARIITSDQVREARIQTIRNEMALPFQVYDISNREQALHWLKES